MADDPISYQMVTVGVTFKVTAQHYTTKLAHSVIQSLHYRLNTIELEAGKMTHFVVYLDQTIK